MLHAERGISDRFIAHMLSRNTLAVGDELVLFNYRGHTRGFSFFQDAPLDATLASYPHWRPESDLRGHLHFNFNGGTTGDRLWQVKVHAP